MKIDLQIKNIGRKTLSINDLKSKTERIIIETPLPIKTDPMSVISIPIKFYSEQKGYFSDTLAIQSDDPKKPVLNLPVTAKVENYFEIIDNENADHYQKFGEWFYSVAQAFGGNQPLCMT